MAQGLWQRPAQVSLDLNSSRRPSGGLLTRSCMAWPGISTLTNRINRRPPGPQALEDRCSPSEREPAPRLPLGTSDLEGSGSQPLPQPCHSEALKPQLTLSRKEPRYHILSLWGLGPAEDREGLRGEAPSSSRMGRAKAWALPCLGSCTCLAILVSQLQPRNSLQAAASSC